MGLWDAIYKGSATIPFECDAQHAGWGDGADLHAGAMAGDRARRRLAPPKWRGRSKKRGGLPARDTTGHKTRFVPERPETHANRAPIHEARWLVTSVLEPKRRRDGDPILILQAGGHRPQVS